MELNLAPQLLLLQEPVGIIRKWSAEDTQLFTELYPITNNRILAVKFNRSISSIQNRANILKLKKDKNIINEGRFKKGHKSWNKGLKGINIGGKSTQFKKGNQPYNTKPLGTISIRYDDERLYIYIKVKNHKWELLHKLNWVKDNGAIPPGYHLRCIDGNTLNCNSENWELVSRRENLIKNQNRKKAGESLAKRRRSERARIYIGLNQKTNLILK